MLIDAHTVFLIVTVLAVMSMFLENSPNDRVEYWDRVLEKIAEKEDSGNG